MTTYISPTGNPEVWDKKPEGYFDAMAEWRNAHPEIVQQEFTDAIQKRLDGFAKTRGYDNIFTAATYATSTNAQFRAEGQYAVSARDKTWDAAYAILGAVLAGARPMPTLMEVFAELPALQWPEGAGNEPDESNTAGA